MYRPRIIPVLLLKDDGLIKTIKFNKKKARYIGDPINAVKIFNDLEADELVFLDVLATKKNDVINLDLVKKIGDEAYMPFAVGGGINNLSQVDKILKFGAEKVVINTAGINNLGLIKEISLKYGSQSIIGSVDVKKNLFGKYVVFIESGKKKIKKSLLEVIKSIEISGAGEIMIQSIDNDGLMTGYDYPLIDFVSSHSNLPVIAAGGCGSLMDMKLANQKGGANALAAGSFFVYHGPRNAVLINYPTKEEIYKNFT